MSKRYKLACASIEDSDQPVHPDTDDIDILRVHLNVNDLL